MPVDVVEKPDSYELHASLPGVPKDTVKVCHRQPSQRLACGRLQTLDGGRWCGAQLDVDGDVIRISSDYKKETEDMSPEGTEPSMRWHRVERVQEYSTRALRMPETADLSKLEASMDAGVLTVKVPKHEAAASKARRIDIK
jgi:HSP20 family molecular chaperone IbpA